MTSSFSTDLPPPYSSINTSQPAATRASAANNHSAAARAASVPPPLEIHKVGDTTAFHVNSQGNTLYYVGHYQALNTPDIVLYAGYDSHGPRLAQTQYIPHSKDFKLYVGDLKTPTSDDWDTVRCADGGMFKDPTHRFECRSQGDGGYSIKKRYYWKKTSDSKLGASKTSPRDFKLVDENDETVVAVYIEHHMGTREKRGTMSFMQAVDPKAQIAALLALLSLLEKSRRFMKSVANAFPSTNSY